MKRVPMAILFFLLLACQVASMTVAHTAAETLGADTSLNLSVSGTAGCLLPPRITPATSPLRARRLWESRQMAQEAPCRPSSLPDGMLLAAAILRCAALRVEAILRGTGIQRRAAILSVATLIVTASLVERPLVCFRRAAELPLGTGPAPLLLLIHISEPTRPY